MRTTGGLMGNIGRGEGTPEHMVWASAKHNHTTRDIT